MCELSTAHDPGGTFGNQGGEHAGEYTGEA